MPFNGDFYTQDEGKAPSHDFYTQNMQNKGVLPGSWQMRQAYANGSGGTEGSNPNQPAFQTTYARDVSGRLGGNTSTYNASGVTGTTSVPGSGESYNSKRWGATGSNEENTVKNFFGAKGKLKKSKESTPGKGSPGGQGSDEDMAIASNNNVKVGKNARQSGNQSGGANIQAGGDIDAGSSVGFGATNNGGVQQIGGENSRQVHNQFMFDPNHPRWSGNPGDKPKDDKPKADTPKPKPTPDNGTPKPGGMFHVVPNKKAPPSPTGSSSTPPTTTTNPPQKPGGMPHGMPRGGGPGSGTPPSSTGSSSPTPQGPSWEQPGTSTPPDQGDNFGGGDPRVVKKTRRKGTPGQAEQPYPKPPKRRVGGQGPSLEQGNEGSLAEKYPDAIEGTSGEAPTTGLPKTTPGTDIEKFRGGVPAETGQTPTTGAPPAGTPTTGAPPKGPGFFGRMWNKAADRVMTAPGGGPINFGPGAEYTRTPDRGLPAGPQVMGEIGTGAPTPMGEIGPGPRAIGPGSRVMGEIGSGDSPASAPIQQVNPRGTYGHPMNGAFGGRGPTRGAPRITRFGDMGMGVPMQGSVPNGVMPPQYEGMGGDYDATGPQTAPSRHPRPGGPRTPYEGPSRHPRPPLDPTATPYVGPSRHPRPGQPLSQGVEASRRFGVESDDYGRPQDFNY